MTTIGTPLSPRATKVMLLGAGELGKEVLMALQRLGVETIAVDREGIRRLAAETLGLPTSPYQFCDSLAELQAAIDGVPGQTGIGYPCVVKPVMSSSGKGQSKIDSPTEVKAAWDHAMAGGRVGAGRALGTDGQVETHFCEPIGHLQVSGDYVESWQPHRMPPAALALSRQIAKTVTDLRLFGKPESFVKRRVA